MKLPRNPAFWIALVLVLLAAVTFLGIRVARERMARKARSLMRMRSVSMIATGLNSAAQDHDNNFVTDTPGSPWTNSNQAFRALLQQFPALLEHKASFYDEGNAWHRGKAFDAATWSLGVGENYLGYVKGLSLDRSPANTPLLMPGGLPGNPGHWGHDPTKMGGVAPGDEICILYVSGSAKVVTPNHASPRCVEVDVAGKPVDQFSKAGGVDPADLLNPE